jgi:hypothetical protein
MTRYDPDMTTKTATEAFDEWVAHRAPRLENTDPILMNVLYAAFTAGWWAYENNVESLADIGATSASTTRPVQRGSDGCICIGPHLGEYEHFTDCPHYQP